MSDPLCAVRTCSQPGRNEVCGVLLCDHHCAKWDEEPDPFWDPERNEAVPPDEYVSRWCGAQEALGPEVDL